MFLLSFIHAACPARHKQQQQQTKEEDTSPALDSPEREISADSGGSTAPMIGTLSDTSSQCSNEDDRRSICSNGSRSSDHLDQTMAVDVCTTPSATQSSHSTDDDHHSKSPTLHDDWSTRTRRDSQQSIITHHLHSSQRTPLGEFASCHTTCTSPELCSGELPHNTHYC